MAMASSNDYVFGGSETNGPTVPVFAARERKRTAARGWCGLALLLALAALLHAVPGPNDALALPLSRAAATPMPTAHTPLPPHETATHARQCAMHGPCAFWAPSLGDDIRPRRVGSERNGFGGDAARPGDERAPPRRPPKPARAL
jgi:hypothetical protein